MQNFLLIFKKWRFAPRISRGKHFHQRFSETLRRPVAGFLSASCLLVLFSACSQSSYTSYDLYASSISCGLIASSQSAAPALLAEDLCLSSDIDLGTQSMENLAAAKAAGLFNRSRRETCYASSMNERIYPASTTKILTAYVALMYADPEMIFTVSAHAVDQVADASLAYLSEGDRISLRDLLYGMMLPSGNDAAVAIAEGIFGSEEAFARHMNEEAEKLGATHSHFVTVNGMHDPDHYTTVYDMYLILDAALSYPLFREVFCSPSYDAVYENASGQAVSRTWTATCWYLNGKAVMPDGFTALGAKTGTTGEAGSCLVLLSKNAKGEELISIIYKADVRTELYVYMDEILSMWGG